MGIEIDERHTIPDGEVTFDLGPSSGPGGQNVNKVETRVTLRFDLAGSAVLSEEEKERVRRRLSTRVSRAGVLRVVAQRHRSQGANREEAVERFAALLREALAKAEPRRPTKVPRRARRRRLQEKRQRSEVKAGRRPPRRPEE